MLVRWLRWLVVGGGQDRLGITHETSLQGLVLPARRKQGCELVLLFSHGLSFFETAVSKSWLHLLIGNGQWDQQLDTCTTRENSEVTHTLGTPRRVAQLFI